MHAFPNFWDSNLCAQEVNLRARILWLEIGDFFQLSNETHVLALKIHQCVPVKFDIINVVHFLDFIFNSNR